jgi:hypothetical protein
MPQVTFNSKEEINRGSPIKSHTDSTNFNALSTLFDSKFHTCLLLSPGRRKMRLMNFMNIFYNFTFLVLNHFGQWISIPFCLMIFFSWFDLSNN